MYFVIITGIPNNEGSYISMIDMPSARGAHNVAASEFRRKNDIPTNIHVSTHTAFKSNDLGEASRFYSELSARIKEAEDERSTGRARGC